MSLFVLIDKSDYTESSIEMIIKSDDMRKAKKLVFEKYGKSDYFGTQHLETVTEFFDSDWYNDNLQLMKYKGKVVSAK